jgi:DNA-binding NarL/FixJ family response regulator
MEKKMIESYCRVKLTTRERELLKLIAEGKNSKGIANIPCLSLKNRRDASLKFNEKTGPP